MWDLSIDLEVFKHIFQKRTIDNQVVTNRILGVNVYYVQGKMYNDLVNKLKFISEYTDYNFDDIIEKYTRKCKIKKHKVDEFKQDKDEFLKLVSDINPSIFHKAKGRLREIQLKELSFTKELLFDIEKNTTLKPFMDDGTLLGAIRHCGFIPWDDDFDFSLMRKDFEKLKEYLKTRYTYIDTSDWVDNKYNEYLDECFNNYPNQVFVLQRLTSLKCYKGIKGDFVVCDFFALDCYNEHHNVETLNLYAAKIRDCVYTKNNEITYGEAFKIYNREINKHQDIVEDSNCIAPGIGNFDFYFYTIKGTRRKDDIFPLQKIRFEDTEFYAPNNPHEYLKTIYNFYNKLPVAIDVCKHRPDFEDIL